MGALDRFGRHSMRWWCTTQPTPNNTLKNIICVRILFTVPQTQIELTMVATNTTAPMILKLFVKSLDPAPSRV